MMVTDYLQAIATLTDGDILAVEWTSIVRPAAAHKGVELVKNVTADVEVGEFEAIVGRESGSLKWGTWNVYPFVIEHKGTYYARLFPVDGTVRATFTVDGVTVDRATFNTFLTAGAAKDSGKPECITVKMENLSIV